MYAGFGDSHINHEDSQEIPVSHDNDKDLVDNFKNETLQITDVHEACDFTSDGSTFRQMESSGSPCIESVESSFSIGRPSHYSQNTLINRSNSHQGQSLQDELADLGFNPFVITEEEEERNISYNISPQLNEVNNSEERVSSLDNSGSIGQTEELSCIDSCGINKTSTETIRSSESSLNNVDITTAGFYTNEDDQEESCGTLYNQDNELNKDEIQICKSEIGASSVTLNKSLLDTCVDNILKEELITNNDISDSAHVEERDLNKVYQTNEICSERDCELAGNNSIANHNHTETLELLKDKFDSNVNETMMCGVNYVKLDISLGDNLKEELITNNEILKSTHRDCNLREFDVNDQTTEICFENGPQVTENSTTTNQNVFGSEHFELPKVQSDINVDDLEIHKTNGFIVKDRETSKDVTYEFCTEEEHQTPENISMCGQNSNNSQHSEFLEQQSELSIDDLCIQTQCDELNLTGVSETLNNSTKIKHSLNNSDVKDSTVKLYTSEDCLHERSIHANNQNQEINKADILQTCENQIGVVNVIMDKNLVNASESNILKEDFNINEVLESTSVREDEPNDQTIEINLEKDHQEIGNNSMNTQNVCYTENIEFVKECFDINVDSLIYTTESEKYNEPDSGNVYEQNSNNRKNHEFPEQKPEHNIDSLRSETQCAGLDIVFTENISKIGNSFNNSDIKDNTVELYTNEDCPEESSIPSHSQDQETFKDEILQKCENQISGINVSLVKSSVNTCESNILKEDFNINNVVLESASVRKCDQMYENITKSEENSNDIDNSQLFKQQLEIGIDTSTAIFSSDTRNHSKEMHTPKGNSEEISNHLHIQNIKVNANEIFQIHDRETIKIEFPKEHSEINFDISGICETKSKLYNVADGETSKSVSPEEDLQNFESGTLFSQNNGIKNYEFPDQQTDINIFDTETNTDRYNVTETLNGSRREILNNSEVNDKTLELHTNENHPEESDIQSYNEDQEMNKDEILQISVNNVTLDTSLVDNCVGDNLKEEFTKNNEILESTHIGEFDVNDQIIEICSRNDPQITKNSPTTNQNVFSSEDIELPKARSDNNVDGLCEIKTNGFNVKDKETSKDVTYEFCTEEEHQVTENIGNVSKQNASDNENVKFFEQKSDYNVNCDKTNMTDTEISKMSSVREINIDNAEIKVHTVEQYTFEDCADGHVLESYIPKENNKCKIDGNHDILEKSEVNVCEINLLESELNVTNEVSENMHVKKDHIEITHAKVQTAEIKTKGYLVSGNSSMTKQNVNESKMSELDEQTYINVADGESSQPQNVEFCSEESYILSENIDIQKQVNKDNILQSFMELTIANENPALCEQNERYNSNKEKVSPSNLNSYYDNCQDDNDLGVTRYCEAMSMTTVVINDECDEDSDSNSHEVMQQSINDYVTTQLLSLNIPDSNEIINSSNEELRQQCETQAENVLLMKWPTQFYDQIHSLENENKSLLEQVKNNKLKEIYMSNLEKENEELRKKLEEVNNQFEESKEKNVILTQRIHEIGESNQLSINELKEENKKLVCDLERFVNVEADLNNLKSIHDESLKTVERLTQEKQKEIEVLNNTIEQLIQELSEIKQSKDGNEKENPNCILLEEISNLKSQNELLWNELKVSTKKEQSFLQIKQERTKLEEIKKELSDIESIKIENQQLIADIEIKEHKISKLIADKKKFKSSLIKASDKLNELEAENEHLKELAEEFSISNEKFKTEAVELFAIKEENQVLSSRVFSLTNSINNLEEEKLNSLGDLSSISESINSIVFEKELLLNELTSTNALYEDLKTTLQKFEEQNSLLNAQIAEKIIAIETIEAKNTQLAQLNDEFIEREQLLINDLNHLNQQFTEMANLKEENNTLSAEIKSLKVIITVLEEEACDFVEGLNNISESISSLMEEQILISNELMQMNGTCDSLGEENVKIKEHNRLLNAKLVESEDAKHNIETQNCELLKTIDHLRNKENLLKDQLHSLESRCSDLMKIKEESSVLISENISLNNDLTNIEEEKMVLMQDLSSISELISSLVEEKILISNELAQKNETCSTIKEENFKIKEQMCLLTVKLAELETDKDSIETQNSELLNMIDHLRNSENLLKNELQSFECQVNELKKIEEENNALTFKNLSLNNAVSNLEEEKAGFMQDLSVISESLSSLLEDNLIMSSQLALALDRNLQLNEVATAKGIVDQQVTTLKQQLLDVQLEKDSLSIHLKHANDKISKLSDLEDLIKDLQDQLANLSEEMKNEILKNQSVLADNNDLIYEVAQVNAELSFYKGLMISKEQELLTTKQLKEQLLENLKENEEMIIKLDNDKLSLQKQNDELTGQVSNLELKNNEYRIELQNVLNTTDKLREENKNLMILQETATQEMENQTNDFKLLRDILAKELHSLIGPGEIGNFQFLSVMDMFQKLMTEFVTKEKEVIEAIQSDCEIKTTTLGYENTELKKCLDDKNCIIEKLEKEVENNKESIIQLDLTVSDLQTELNKVKEELSVNNIELEKIKQTLIDVENERDAMLKELNNAQYSKIISDLEETISAYKHEIAIKSNAIVELQSEIQLLKSGEADLVEQLENANQLANQHQEAINEVSSKLAQDQDLISKYCTEIKDLMIQSQKLISLENEIDMMNNVLLNSFNAEQDIGKVLPQMAENCNVFGNVMKLIADKWDEQANKVQLLQTNIESELAKKTEMCTSLEIQINRLSEELRVNRMLYDENVVKLQEEISDKNNIITTLTEANTKLNNDYTSVIDKLQNVNGKELQDEFKLLKEEKAKFLETQANLKLVRKVNGKLSWEIEDLSRQIKLEKQANNELKSKCDSANNKIAELKKQNYSLEDKIYLLENKLQNQSVLSSIKITFPSEVDTVDKQVYFINDRLGEFNQLRNNLETLKLEHDKCSAHIKRQEEKMSKILKRELDLKKQIASTTHHANAELRTVECVQSELMSLIGDEKLSLPEVMIKIKDLVQENNELKALQPNIELKKKFDEVSHENNILNGEHEIMSKRIKEQEEMLAAILKQAEELKKVNSELKVKLNNQKHVDSNYDSNEYIVLLFEVFPEKPQSFEDALEILKKVFAEVTLLKEQITEAQEQYESLDNECESMLKAYQQKEQDLTVAFKLISDMKLKEKQHEEGIKQLSDELKKVKSGNSAVDYEKFLNIFPEKPSSLEEAEVIVKRSLDEVTTLKEKLSETEEDYKTLDNECENMFKAYQLKEQELVDAFNRESKLVSEIKIKEKQYEQEIKLLSDQLKGANCDTTNKDLEELFNILPGNPISVGDANAIIKRVLKEVALLKEKLSEVQEESKSIFKAYKEKEDDLADILKRYDTLLTNIKMKEKQYEETLKLLSDELKMAKSCATTMDLEKLMNIFPEKPSTFNNALTLIKSTFEEVVSLKQQISILPAYEKSKESLLEEEIRLLSDQLQSARSQLSRQETNDGFPKVGCQCDELKSRLNEMKLNIADRNAKITALELQFEADNFPLKKKIIDLEKSLDQLKNKNNELKGQVRKYQDQMHEVTVGVGLQSECERCNRPKASLGVQTSPAAPTDSSTEELNKQISILKCLCRSRNQKIAELEMALGTKLPRSQRSALKERKENTNVPSPSPTKTPKTGF